MSIEFKNENDRQFFNQIHPKLKERLEFMSWYYEKKFGKDFVITRIYENDGSTHASPPPYRFADARCLDIEAKEAEFLRVLVNKIFPYGLNSKGKPADTIVELNHGNAPHFHIQVKA